MVRGNQARRWYEQYQADVARQAAYEARQKQRNTLIASAQRVVGGAAAGTAIAGGIDYVTPQKASKSASGISPKDKMAHHIRRDSDDDMPLAAELSQAFSQDVSDKQVSTNARMAFASGGESKGSQETRITYQRPQYGLSETTTQILPSTTYFSIITPTSSQTMTKFQFRLTSLLDSIITGLVDPAPGASYAAGVYDVPMITGSTGVFTNPLRSFPSTATDNFQWRNWFSKMYQYYTVLGCEWEITMYNPQTNRNCDIVYATTIDTYSPTNNTNEHPSTATMREMEQWPDVRWGVVRSHATSEGETNTKTISGYYKPGMVKQSVENDEDVKTWTKIGNTPALTEIMNFYVGKSWINDITAATGLNVRLKQRLIVQYKDLNPTFRWPTSTQTAITCTAPTNIII